MCRKPRVRTLIDNQHLKGSEKTLKTARQYFRHIFRSVSKEISLKNAVLAVCEILKLIVNILTPGDKYSLSVKASV